MTVIGAYVRILLVSVVAGMLVAAASAGVLASPNLLTKFSLAGAAIATAAGALWSFRLRLPPVRIAQRYGLLAWIR
jgi:hypothetical protein